MDHELHTETIEKKKLQESLDEERSINLRMEELIKSLERQKKNASIEIERLQSQINQLRVQVEGHLDSVKFEPDEGSYALYRASRSQEKSDSKFGFPAYRPVGVSQEEERVDLGRLKQKNENLNTEFEGILHERSQRSEGSFNKRSPGGVRRSRPAQDSEEQ